MTDITWQRSSHCHANGTCVELATIGGRIAVRDAKHPDGHRLAFERHTWTAFTNDLKASR